jgi:hypothetical protein
VALFGRGHFTGSQGVAATRLSVRYSSLVRLFDDGKRVLEKLVVTVLPILEEEGQTEEAS